MSLKVEMYDDEKGNRVARLLEEINYKVTTKTEIIHISVKEGFEYDGASIPKAFWWLIGSPFSGKYRLAATIHDALYATQLTTREESDDIFYNIMVNEGVAIWKAKLMYTAVLAFGGSVYKKTHEQMEAERKFVEVRYEPIDT
jgi:hypothetical protein